MFSNQFFWSVGLLLSHDKIVYLLILLFFLPMISMIQTIISVSYVASKWCCWWSFCFSYQKNISFSDTLTIYYVWNFNTTVYFEWWFRCSVWFIFRLFVSVFCSIVPLRHVIPTLWEYSKGVDYYEYPKLIPSVTDIPH